MKSVRRSWNSRQRWLGSKSTVPPRSLAMAIGSSRMSQQGASYRAAGVDYEALDAGKRLAIAKALSTSPLLERARRPRARRLARRAGVRLRAGRAHARVRRRGARHEVDDRAARCSRSRASTASPTSPTTRSPRSSTTCAASARCRSSSTPTSRPAPPAWYAQAERARRRCVEGWRRALRGRRLRVGRRRVAVAARAARRRRRSSWPAPPSARVPPGRAPILGEELAPGDEIVLVASSGLHANGASLARMIAERLPEGYATPLPGTGTQLRRGAARAVA